MDFGFENDIEKSPSNVYVPLLIKSIGEEDADGNYIFEVEASNENLDLQNQRIQQNALLKSKEFFITNGVISDDHQHKRYDKNGNVISDKSKIIGEPISVRTEGTSTFVKGKLYGNNDFAKEYIRLLKAHSSRVKASVGGIMPTVRRNPDGTETVTAFRWNDLALTCSPVNYTVGSAVFAKSLSNLDFCKALTAGSGTDAATMTDGRALQGEDLENSTSNILPENRPNEISKTEESDIDTINELMAAISTGEIKTQEEMEAFLVERGFDEGKARASVREIISQGGHTIMAKSVLEQTKNLLKSLTGGTPSDTDDEKDKKKPDEEPTPDVNTDGGSENGDGGDDDDNGGEKPVEKSLPNGYSDGTELLCELVSEVKKSNETVAALTKRIEAMEAQQDDVSKSVLEVAKSLGEIAASPIPKKSATSIQKSNVGGGSAGGSSAFTVEDWEIAKSALIAAAKDENGGISIEKSEHLSSACQRALRGEKMSLVDWREMSALIKKYGN